MAAEQQDIQVLSQLINDEHGKYRVRVGERVHYITIAGDVFDEDTMCRPYLLIPQLPNLPPGAWTTMNIARDAAGSLVSTISTDPLPKVKALWHARHVDVLSLPQTRRFRSGVHEVQWTQDSVDVPGGAAVAAVAKIACFSWDIARIERETQAYSVLADLEPPIAPRFLGHITENGRPMGLLLEKVDGEPAGSADLAACEAVMGKLHDAGLVHGDPNRYNFVVDRRPGGGIRLVDFEFASNFDEETARAELLSLPAELSEETGRGGTVERPE
ncbi:alpha-galactosidase a [Ophiostoma piceae UAMH 11346]|uniref:Alpha-galactosidase a n=1 Tax=Ophiostoma piceae (strain UAMH 11346) TaxID=1262450 RepID=S3CYK9_OPHP1|nr:alpha-galactosidase a [Ophiostoma piceae UAMH 11346]